MGQTVWITGASSGIGEALAKAYAKRGDTVILSARNKEKLEKEYQKQLLTAVESKEWEQAAKYRDKIRKVQSEQFDEICRLNDIREGFNAWRNTILLVMPSYSKEQRIVEQFLKSKREGL